MEQERADDARRCSAKPDTADAQTISDPVVVSLSNELEACRAEIICLKQQLSVRSLLRSPHFTAESLRVGSASHMCITSDRKWKDEDTDDQRAQFTARKNEKNTGAFAPNHNHLDERRGNIYYVITWIRIEMLWRDHAS